MRTLFKPSVVAICLAFTAAYAQPGHPGMGMGMGGMGPGPRGPDFSGANAKLFADVPAFSAKIEMQSKGPGGEPLTIPGKMAFDHGKARFEMDLTQMKSASMPPEASAHMKSMGMDKMYTISLPEKKATYLVYPGLQAYVENPAGSPTKDASPEDYKAAFTELGKETVDGHPCTKSKAVVTDKEGKQYESTVWQATDLKKFPLKIEQTQQGMDSTMLFKDVKLSAPDASEFELPKDLTKYDNMQTMMREVMMKRFGGGVGGPPPQPGK